jgi:hypothetical protein
MRTLTLALAVCALGLAAIGTSSAAAPQHFFTEINHLDSEKTPGGLWIGGVVDSEKSKCRADREMSVIATGAPHGSNVLDEGLVTSKHGGWAFLIEGKIAGSVKVKAQKRVLGNGDICDGQSVVLV